MSTLVIIGGGTGEEKHLTPEAREAIRGASRIYAPHRLAKSLSCLNAAIRGADTGEMLRALEEQVSDAAVVVSGDAGFFSLSRTLSQGLGGRYQIRRICGVSSLQLFCAALGTEYDDCKVISTHGRSAPVLGAVSYHPKVFVLTGGGADAANILRGLCAAGLEELSVSVGENLGSPQERIRAGTAAGLAGESFGGLVVLLLENRHSVDGNSRLRDEDFIRGETPMTKEAVRALSVYRLEVQPADVVYDIGAGTGSVAVALARKARDGMVFAVERNAAALALIGQNRLKFGAYNLQAVPGSAPEALEPLPPPDKVFIGGSGGGLSGILEALCARAPRFSVCINTITLESLGAAVDGLGRLGFQDIGVECTNIASARKTGGYHMMLAQNPAYIISGGWG